MARYKAYDYGQRTMVEVDFERQIVPGTFEYALHRLIEERLDLAAFDAR
jgi:hypothetical protein